MTEPLADPADERIDHATEFVPNLVVSTDGDLTVATALVHGVDAIEAGVEAAKALETSGIRVLRTYQDLVTRQDVADRLGVTRQAVGNWVRGERHDDTPFPSPVSRVAGGVWLWGDVVAWARSCNYDVDEVQLPSLEDHVRLDLLIAAGVRNVTVSSYSASADIAFRHRGAHATLGATYQRSYALAS
ncbi:helix-turn-helix transcriptional regulator [Mycobacteroides abscessus]|uniref:helix-turn-helix transcriptional regulator n=1 Tax=Mycobacteroides abscessus TaxID=36809 RepID=UPI002104FC47|nr:helix-turn-helix transcriptional regulator [Mycobacteroides abscessus]